MKMRNLQRFIAGAAMFNLVTVCAMAADSKVDASAVLAPASGSQVNGTVTFTRTDKGVHLEANLSGLTPGEHGFHLHEAGDCSAADASSAKGHFNPANKMHGPHEGEHHAGDILNLKADAAGKARYSADLSGLQIGSGETNIVGRAVIVHADPDDYKTQPAGNSGKRIACGVIKAG